MATNVADEKHLQKWPLIVDAEWQYVGDIKQTTNQGKPFAMFKKVFENGKEVSKSDWLNAWHYSGVAPPLDEFVEPILPVMYMPVKKRNGVDGKPVETFPKLRLSIKLQLEWPPRSKNWEVPDLEGKEVEIEISNLWQPNAKPYKMPDGTGTLKRLSCVVELDAAQVKQLLDPKGPMQARLNENLLSFQVKIRAVAQNGKALQGVSKNRVFLYRRKMIVFLPGVFGSKIEVITDHGQKAAFPNWSGRLNQTVGALECDATGEPILQADKTKLQLLELGGFVNDTCDEILRANNRLLPELPESFPVYPVRPFPYDWRGDLVQQSQNIMQRLTELRKTLEPDTDDQIALAGHSTGGVIMRYMLGLPEASSMISHAFFINVPFRGAPKALCAYLTGRSHPDYTILDSVMDRMIPFIEARSLRNCAVCMPIVYHLAPSMKYPYPVAKVVQVLQGEESLPTNNREAEKKGLIEACANRGIYFHRYVVDKGYLATATLKERTTMAEEADDWSLRVDDYGAHLGGKPLYDKLGGEPARKFHEMQLGWMNSPRSPMLWNDYLAQKAAAFHKKSEAVAAKGDWADKAYLFYSKGHPTTGSLTVYLRKSQDCGSRPEDLLYKPPPDEFEPPTGLEDRLDDPVEEGSARPRDPWSYGGRQFSEQWDYSTKTKTLQREYWCLAANDVDGDGTVPLCSQLGFGGRIKTFRANPEAPVHMESPNSIWLWSRVMEVLHGIKVTGMAEEGEVDTIDGKEKK